MLDFIVEKVSELLINITVGNILLPTLCLLLLVIEIRFKKISTIFARYKSVIINIIDRYKFNELFEKGEASKLELHYIAISLIDAKSDDEQKKKLAILQLSQYSKNEAFYGLIKILAREKQDSYRYIMINSLKKNC